MRKNGRNYKEVIMDLVTLALAKKMAGSGGGSTTPPSYDDLIPSIGENGH
jgi:hypothetical protein